jgi:uncharacterized protein (TIRG00374 family)
MNRAFLFLLIKVCLTGIIIYLLVNKIDYSEVLTTLKQVSCSLLSFSVLLNIAGILATAKRWQTIISSLSKTIPWWDTCYHTVIGAFLSQCLPSSVGGDVYKGITLKQRYKIPTILSISATLIDRIYGILSFVVFSVLGCLVEWKSLIKSSVGELIIALIMLISAGFIALSLLKLAKKKLPLFMMPLVQFSESISLTFSHKMNMLTIALTSFIASFCLIMAAYLLSIASGLEITFSQILVAIPVVIIISAIPISFAGWGLREGAMVVILSIYGIPKEQALAFSLLFGVMQFLAAFPGLILWCFAKPPQLSLDIK